MNLTELREHWETTLNVLLAVVCMESTLYVLLEKPGTKYAGIVYYVHRYFPIGDNTKDRWEVSTDLETEDLTEAIRYVNKRMKEDLDAWLKM